jgi:hypothetical protein
MCAGHHQRWWRSEGRPDLEQFIATTDPQDWQQFADPHVDAVLTFTPSGSAVHLRAGRTVTDTAWESDSFLFDVPT